MSDRGSGPRRSTRQRAAIAAALERADGFRSAQEIHEDIRSSGEPGGLATVYRTLQSLVEHGEVDVLPASDGSFLYRTCHQDDHHHHLVCRACRKTIELDAAEVEEWATRVASEHGFSTPTHPVELFGLCEECAPS